MCGVAPEDIDDLTGSKYPPALPVDTYCATVVLPVEHFAPNGEVGLNCLFQPRGQPHRSPRRKGKPVVLEAKAHINLDRKEGTVHSVATTTAA
jgi:hypothetical protein